MQNIVSEVWGKRLKLITFICAVGAFLSVYLDPTVPKADKTFWSLLLYALLFLIPFFCAIAEKYGWALFLGLFSPVWGVLDVIEKVLHKNFAFWIPFAVTGAVAFILYVVLGLLNKDKKSDLLGSAAWGDSLGAHGSPKFSMFNLGRFIEPGEDCGKFFYQLGHILTCAPSGAGKGIGAVIPNLIEYGGSIFCNDIKGENWAVTHKHRSTVWESKVILLDPFNVTGQETRDAYNLFSWLSHFPEEITSDSAMIADALVISSEGSESSFWDDSAKNLIRGLIAYISTYTDENIMNRNIGELRRIITLPSALLASIFQDMASSPILVVERCANALMGMDEKTRAGVLTTAQQHTAFLDEMRIVDCLSSSTFDIEDFKAGNMTIYLVLPPEKLSSNSRLMRLIISMLITSVTRVKTKPVNPALFLFDEFAQLGRMAIVEDTLSLIRGYGAYYWFIIQDLSQLKAVYKKWQGFLSNTTKQFFSTADYDTAKYISDSLGQSTIEFNTSGSSEGSSSGLTIQSGSSSTGDSTSGHIQARNLLNPDEILSMSPETVIVLTRGEKPYRLQRLNYLKDADYQGFYEKNPMHN